MKIKNLVLWGTKKGEKYESFITEEATMKKIEKAAVWAAFNGYEKLRVSKYAGEAPDFIDTLAK